MEKVELHKAKIVFFDGVCHLCNGFVDSVITIDTNHIFYFAPLQGETAQKLLPAQDRAQLDSVIYYESEKLFYSSTAVLKILIGLGGLYRVFMFLWVIPRPVRDFVYGIIARNRYQWFGKREFCRLPRPDERSYLLP